MTDQARTEHTSDHEAAADASDAAGGAMIDLAVLNETLEYIRPALQADGGDLILLGTEEGTVNLQLVGACGGCPMSTMTLTAGIERILKDRVPGVEAVNAE
jgi:Fe-S cluster biogenesis protein NfuA